MSKVEFYKSKNGWRWRVRASNGLILANSGQGYSRRCDCVTGFRRACAARADV